MDARSSRYHDVYARWQRDPEGFWGEAAQAIDWIETPKKVFDKDAGIYGRWFTGGVCNTCYNALDRHVLAGRNDQVALIYDSPVTNTVKTFTYGRMLSEVQLLGAMLRDFGVGQGDVVILYMPMVPEAVFAMLACARIGAIHSVVFGGFAPKELATRIDDAKPKLILSASCGIEGARVVPYKPLLDEAIKLAKHKPPTCLILQRPQCEAALTPGRDHDWRKTWEHAVEYAKTSACVPVLATDPLYILYTSGTTGIPKGVVRLRHRLGGRPLLHRLRAAVPRRHLDHVRGQAGRHARPGCVLARDRAAPGGRAVHRADRLPRHQEGRPAGQVHRPARSVEIPHAVLGRRARRPADHPVGRADAGQAGDRPLVADRDRLVHRRQS